MIKKISSNEVYKNKWISVREDTVAFDNGAEGIYAVVDKPDFVLIIPFDGEFLKTEARLRPLVSGRTRPVKSRKSISLLLHPGLGSSAKKKNRKTSSKNFLFIRSLKLWLMPTSRRVRRSSLAEILM